MKRTDSDGGEENGGKKLMNFFFLQMKQVAGQLVSVQVVMWRLQARVSRHLEVRTEMRDLGWEELHMRLQLRSLQIENEIGKEVKNLSIQNYFSYSK